MRVPTVERRRPSRFRPRGWLIGAAVAVVVLLFSLRGLAGFYTDYLWFDSVEQSDTWRALLSARVMPALVFTIVFFAIMFANLLIADRLAPKYRSMGPEDELVERYQQAIASYTGRIRVVVALFFALVAGVGVSSQWRQWVLFTNRVDFGVKDPQFHKDVGFYVFQLPFLRFIADWLFAGLVIVLLVTAVAHYLNGGIRFQSPFQRVTPQVKAHLSVILALMALVKTAQYYLAQFELNFSSRGVVDGASYTDVKAQLPALRLLMFISVAAAALFIWNIWRRGWILPVIAVGLWGFVSIVIGTIYPAGVQRFSVGPNEFQSEEPYIGRNINATRTALGIGGVETTEFNYQEAIEPEEINANRPTIDNARLWDPNVTEATYQTLQGFQTYYKIDDVDIDRYEINGETRQVVLSAREINSDELPSQSWVNRHLVYTHGYGIVAAPTNAATDDGDPEFLVEGIPLADDAPIDVAQPRLYFGESLPGYALVDAKQDEFDFPTEEGTADATTRYDGKDGVGLSNIVRRAAFALRFADINPLISGQVTGSTKILYERDIRDRVYKLAPFLDFDDDPYPVVDDGKVVWVLDGYTTTNRYPYSQSVSGSGGLAHDFNYARNSVKATVDAYDGTVTFYVIDDEDPLIRAYDKAFPDLFTDFDEMPDVLRAHLRYPEDLFTVQSDLYARYHVTDERRFYQGNAQWLRSPDPGSGTLEESQLITEEDADEDEDSDEPQDATSTTRRMEPYYLFITLPGETEPSFIILQPFVPISAENRQTRLVSFMVARSDPDTYGEMTAFEMPQGELVRGPVQVNNEIASTAEISRELSLIDQRGSTVISGSLQLIPVGDSILYIRPIYVRGSGTSGFPQFRFVAVFTAGRSPVLATSVEDGLNQLFGLAPAESPTDGEEPAEDDEEPASEDVQVLLDRAAERFNEAQEALQQGDLGGYQALMEEVGELIEQARQAQSGGSTTTT
ncbi:MAG TPA: UPF0182 family protein [Acidimicrobiia bacterium]|nr:UPF0182 family protein [Acidimicrobiia bacterium]